MKRLKHITLLTATLIALAIGCKDEKLNPYVPPQGNAHGFGQFTSQYDNTTLLPQFGNNQFYDQTAIDRVVFFDGNATAANQSVPFQLQWQSIDNRIKIATIELYVEYFETYTDAARNPKTANHGGPTREELGSINASKAPGVFWKSIPAGDARVSQAINITGDDVYSLYQNNTFDYDGAGPNPPVNIFTGHPYNAATGFNRSTAATRFLPNRTYTIPGVGDVALAADAFRINWRLIADDGTAYASWSPSVCSSVVGATCFGQWRVASNIFNPRVTVTRESGAKAALKAGDVTTLTMTYAIPNIATSVPVSAPTVAIGAITGFTGSRGTLGTVTPGSSPNVYTVT
ncbi:MAG: hypothetical protein K2U26_04570, partial [Cyclobacteriaceae bacterium]|nr:hypothetical protein [Cyclobacteriaceae bacterium]